MLDAEVRVKTGGAGGFTTSFSQVSFTIPMTEAGAVALAKTARVYVPEGVVFGPPAGPPWTVIVSVEVQAAVQVFVVNDGEACWGSPCTPRVTEGEDPVKVPKVTVAPGEILVPVDDTGLVTVIVMGLMEIG